MFCYNKTKVPANKAIFYPLLGNIVNDIFESTKKETTSNNKRLKYNIQEFDDRHVLTVALPGFSKDRVEIRIENELLTISDISNEKDQDQSFRLREFNYGGFKQIFRLPETVDQDQINAFFKAGILTLELGKKKEAIPQPPREIKID